MVLKCSKANRTHSTRTPQVPVSVAMAGISVEPSPRHTPLVTSIKSHAIDFISKRLAPANPQNDGKQTPMKGHPVFVAQHATATCCRGCLEKWHKIVQGKELSDRQQEYIVKVIMTWVEQKYNN